MLWAKQTVDALKSTAAAKMNVFKGMVQSPFLMF
jgi:hypothetical protein